MTTQELNRDINRLYKAIEKSKGKESYYEDLENVHSKEFKRLYNADNNFEYMNKKSILILMVLNRRFRFIPFHNFGININL